MNTQVSLLGARRFMPLFATQTLGAFNDNLFKSAFVMLVTYGTAMRTDFDPGVLAAMAACALIAPYFLFSALAGELIDGNALLEGGTFLSILLGTIAGSLAVAVAAGTELAGLLLVLCAVGGFAASLFVPRAPAPS